MQIETMMGYNLIAVRTAVIERKRHQVLARMWGDGALGPWGTVWRLLKELEIELPHDPAILLLSMCMGIYPK